MRGTVSISVHALFHLTPTLALRGTDDDYPHFTVEETGLERGGDLATTGNSRARPLAESCLPPRPELTTVVLSCLLDTTPTLRIDKQAHKHSLSHTQTGLWPFSPVCTSHVDI